MKINRRELQLTFCLPFFQKKKIPDRFEETFVSFVSNIVLFFSLFFSFVGSGLSISIWP